MNFPGQYENVILKTNIFKHQLPDKILLWHVFLQYLKRKLFPRTPVSPAFCLYLINELANGSIQSKVQK